MGTGGLFACRRPSVGLIDHLFPRFQEAKKSKTVIWWNVWVLLAMPVIWLTWYVYIVVR